jgi:uncharacterized membrane protein
MAKTASKAKKKTKPSTTAKVAAAPAPQVSAKTKPLSKLKTVLPWILVISAVIGIVASVAITQEKIDLASNAHYQPVCDLNPVISCGSVMKSPQAHTFGFMNPFIGLVGFPIVLAIGMGMFAGAKFKRWFWLGAQAGLAFGIIFAYWLLFESVYRIHALCPWCLSVDVAMTVLIWYVTLFNFYEGNLILPKSLKATGQFVKRHHLDILVLWFLIVIALILKHFWYYYGNQI